MHQNGRNVNSHLLKHHIEKWHQCLQNKDFVITNSGFGNSKVKIKTSEALCIKDPKPISNKQEKSVNNASLIDALYTLVILL